MQISLKWINELLNTNNVNLESLITKLTLSGFEIEEVQELNTNQEKDFILDISATANRSDSLSIQGISTEIATLLDQPIKLSPYSCTNLNWKKKIKKSIKSMGNLENNEYCSSFASIVIENINDTSIPTWVKEKLLKSGVMPVNNLMDFQNYVLLETGYPFAFYDFDQICSTLKCNNFTLSFSQANADQKFFASNEIYYPLSASTILLNANDKPISIAGVIEHKSFCYTDKTKSVLIEGSIFNASNIRQQSRNLGLRTDRSARYEKSLKSTYLLESFYRLISLLRIKNPDIICKFHTIYTTNDQSPISILLHYQTINEILGPINNKTGIQYILPETVTNYLTRLNFSFSYDSKKLLWDVTVLESRSEDITREIDLIEEIGRLHGFNNFLTTLPKLKTIGHEDSSYKIRKKITSCLLPLGFTEFVHYALVNQTTFLKNEIQVLNPLVLEYSTLRSSLLPNLITTVQKNLSQGNGFIEGFEYGHVFFTNASTKLIEKEYLAGIFGGFQTKSNWSEVATTLSWFEAKAKIMQFLNQLNLLVNWKNESLQENILFHPYRTATLYGLKNQRLGLFGQIHPLLSSQLGLPSEIYLFEFDLNLIQKITQENKVNIYKEYSFYPKIIKDISFIIDQEISFDDLKTALYLNGTNILSEINLLDEYRGKLIPENSKSLCLQLIFHSNQKTLQNTKIDSILKNLEQLLIDIFDAKIRN